MDPEIIVGFFGLIGVFLTSIITGLVTYKLGAKTARVAEREAASEAQKSVNEAFNLLVQTLQADRKEMRQDIASMKQEIHMLTLHVSRLEAQLSNAGHVVPPRPARARSTGTI